MLEEFPYLERKEPAIEAILQKAWDRDWQAMPVLVLLIGSDEAMMEALTEQGRPLSRHVGGFWNRASTIEVDLVGGDARPVARRIGFVGSIKWRREDPFSRADGLALAARRDDVPGAGEETLLVGVSSTGFDDDAPLDVRLTPEDLVEAWRSIE